jgi:hypothetical protein
MDEAPWIAVKRCPYEEPHHTQIEVGAWNGAFGGAVDIYCSVRTIGEIGRGLLGFPSKVPDEYEFVYGSDDPSARVYRYFRMRAYTTDSAGHCAIQFVMDLNTKAPDEGRCCFSIVAEPARINLLGDFFCRLEGDERSRFRWTAGADEFFPGQSRRAV